MPIAAFPLFHRDGGEIVPVFRRIDEAFLRLGTSFPGHTYQGSGLDPELLQRAGVRSADAVIVLTGGDNRNVMIAQLVQRQYGVQVIGQTDAVSESFYAISVERKVKHPGIVAITEGARRELFTEM